LLYPLFKKAGTHKTKIDRLTKSNYFVRHFMAGNSLFMSKGKHETDSV
jgi:hypothetical protein